jgi:hypothetical protein
MFHSDPENLILSGFNSSASDQAETAYVIRSLLQEVLLTTFLGVIVQWNCAGHA